MNERIRELAEQAKNYAYRAVMGGEECQEAYTKKFAELIVAECIDVVSDCSVEYCIRPQIVSEIRKHFGVE